MSSLGGDQCTRPESPKPQPIQQIVANMGDNSITPARTAEKLPEKPIEGSIPMQRPTVTSSPAGINGMLSLIDVLYLILHCQYILQAQYQRPCSPMVPS